MELTEVLLSRIDGYIKGTLTKSELDDFQKQLDENTLLQEEVRLQKQLFDTLGSDSWNSIEQDEKNEALQKLKEKLRSEEYQNLSNTIRNVGKDYLANDISPAKTKRKYRYYAVAATIALFISLYFMQSDPSLNSYYHAYANWNNLPSVIEKGQTEDLFSKGELVFKKENYKEAISYFEAVNSSDELYPFSLMYLGASYDKLNENEKAIAAFDKLIESDSQENMKGYWYKVLIYLKLNDQNKVEEILNIILESEHNDHYEEAFQLLKKMEK